MQPKSLARLVLEVWLDLAVDAQVRDWAEREIMEKGVAADPRVFDLLGLAPKEAQATLAAIASDSGFVPVSTAGRVAAVGVLHDLVVGCLRKEVSVPELCRVVQKLDGAFVGAPPGVGFPDGLWELQNTCERCDPAWVLDGPYGPTSDQLRAALKLLRASDDLHGEPPPLGDEATSDE